MSKAAPAILGALLLVAGAEAAIGVNEYQSHAEFVRSVASLDAATAAMVDVRQHMPLIVTPVPFDDVGQGRGKR